MKQSKNKISAILLLVLLALSLLFNLLQSSRIDRLIEEVREMEAVQASLSAYISSLEAKCEQDILNQ